MKKIVLACGVLLSFFLVTHAAIYDVSDLWRLGKTLTGQLPVDDQTMPLAPEALDELTVLFGDSEDNTAVSDEDMDSIDTPVADGEGEVGDGTGSSDQLTPVVPGGQSSTNPVTPDITVGVSAQGQGGDSGLSDGELAGVIIGSILSGVALGVGGMYLWNKRKVTAEEAKKLVEDSKKNTEKQIADVTKQIEDLTKQTTTTTTTTTLKTLVTKVTELQEQERQAALAAEKLAASVSVGTQTGTTEKPKVVYLTVPINKQQTLPSGDAVKKQLSVKFGDTTAIPKSVAFVQGTTKQNTSSTASSSTIPKSSLVVGIGMSTQSAKNLATVSSPTSTATITKLSTIKESPSTLETPKELSELEKALAARNKRTAEEWSVYDKEIRKGSAPKDVNKGVEKEMEGVSATRMAAIAAIEQKQKSTINPDAGLTRVKSKVFAIDNRNVEIAKQATLNQQVELKKNANLSKMN